MRVLVTDGDNRAALAITRSLGNRGHEVVVAERRRPALAQVSRFCARALAYPDPATDEAAFLQWLVDTIRTERIDAVLPVADITTLLVTANRARFGPDCLVPFGSHGDVDRAADKVELLRMAQRLRVPIPRTWFLESPDASLPEDLPFPVVIKPHRSRVRTASCWLSLAVSYANDREALANGVRSRDVREYPLILQERLMGPGLGVFCCYSGGRPVALFSHRRLREKPPWGGVSVLSESVPMCVHALAAAQRLLGELAWEGVAMVEFKRDVRDGVPKLMEINGRFWGSLQLAIDAGVDFPSILLDTLQGRAPEGPVPYRIGVRSRWLWGDVDSLILRLAAPRSAPAVPGDRGRLAALADFCHFWSRNLKYENPRWHDLGPWLLETRRWLTQSLRPPGARRRRQSS